MLSNHTVTVLPLREAAADAGKGKVIILFTNGSRENLPVQRGYYFKYLAC